MKLRKGLKGLALMLAIVLSLSMFACGDKEENVDSGNATAETVGITDTDAPKETVAETEGEKSDTVASEATETEIPVESETETDAPQVKCKHTNAGLSVEKGCIIWCPDCESQAGAKTYHKNKLTYVDGEGYYSICSECHQRSGDGKNYLVEWNAETLGTVNASGIAGVYNADGGYTRFEGNGKTAEAYMHVVLADEANYEVTGQYMMIKYRTNVAEFMTEGESEPNYKGNFQIYCATSTAQVGKGKMIDFKSLSDGEWHIAVFDLSDGSVYAPDSDGYYVAKHLRVDLINPTRSAEKDAEGNVIKEYAPLPEGYYMDVAFIVMCDDPDSFVSYFKLNEADKALCNHAVSYTNDNCMEACAGCGKEYSEKHTYDCKVEEVDGSNKYVMVCEKCEKSLSYTVDFGSKVPNVFFDPKHLADAAANGTRMGNSEFFVEDGQGFVRLHANVGADKEGFFFLVDEGSALETGKYMVIKYRTTCSNNWEIFVGNEGEKPSSSSKFYVETSTTSQYCDPIRANGEWQLMFIDLSNMKGSAVKADESGKAVLGHLRWDIFNIIGADARYIDIAYVAFANDIDVLKAINGDFSNYCNHSKLNDGFALVTDGYSVPMKKGACASCGAEVAVELNLDFYIDAIIGSGEHKSRDASVFDLSTVGVTAKADNTLYIKGWYGVDFGADAIAYKVYDKDGNLLNGGWTIMDGVKLNTPDENNNVTKTVVESGIDGAHARRFDNVVVDLGEYFAQYNDLTVEYAVVINGISSDNANRYVTFYTVTNVAKAN